jgi:hypothetical protein
VDQLSKPDPVARARDLGAVIETVGQVLLGLDVEVFY